MFGNVEMHELTLELNWWCVGGVGMAQGAGVGVVLKILSVKCKGLG